jgi:hypothetical protein
MRIKDFFLKIVEYINTGCQIGNDSTNVLATRDTKRGLETAEILDFCYNSEIDCWTIKVKDWETSSRKEPAFEYRPGGTFTLRFTAEDIKKIKEELRAMDVDLDTSGTEELYN